jgi:hypothetical protein
LDKPAADAPVVAENYDALKLIMNTTFKDVVDMWDGHITFDDKHKIFDFAIEDVKWYDSFPDVTGFDNMLPAIEELGFCYEFIRVGEQNGDVEYRQSNDHNCYLNTTTSITCYF